MYKKTLPTFLFANFKTWLSEKKKHTLCSITFKIFSNQFVSLFMSYFMSNPICTHLSTLSTKVFDVNNRILDFFMTQFLPNFLTKTKVFDVNNGILDFFNIFEHLQLPYPMTCYPNFFHDTISANFLNISIHFLHFDDFECICAI